ncbi:MAG: hypothetical protein GWN99_18435 [Gemmatimonadetes bacterium]|nr:hypothetical protein [Gemmatimonadota bacterium]NIS03015.1 hypothetical protein [Gemmatimonadota bacterium]NIT68732.1 hypothetical protein [Gemmatimonadota bacterium]NIU53313.1 hypothetical protein [Gemmatimonadota bacterium]NIV25414.1 hypothetical protein [Gemmatimonadota bacterium]
MGRWAGLALLGLLALAGCADSTGNTPPDMVDESELDFVPRRATAPAVQTRDTSFWAVRGEERRLEIRYTGEGTGKKFLEFEVDDESLLRRPDGTLFAVGDSIEISVQVDSTLFLVNLEPSGLVFNPERPAVLELDYDEAEEEFLARESEFDAWRQEATGDPWFRVGSVQVEELDEIEILIFGFTRYALAVGR